MNAYGQKKYQQTQVTTVDKGRLIVLLFEGAIKFLHQAKDCAECGDIAGKSNYINRVLDIIAELNQSLNLAEGGDLAVNLRQLYIFWSEHLIQAKIRKETRNIEDVIKMMDSLNEAWNQVVNQREAQDAMPKSEGFSLKAQVTI